jgi:hypothetical protein
MRLLLELGRLFQLLECDDLFLDEQVTQPLRHISPVSRLLRANAKPLISEGIQRRVFALTQIVNATGIPKK